MSGGKVRNQDFYVFTPHGVFLISETTALKALRRFVKNNPQTEVLGIFRDELIVKPPTEPGATKPFLCMFVQGKLDPQPPVEQAAIPPGRGQGGSK